MDNHGSPSLDMVCYNCRWVTAEFHQGWRLDSGEYAMLCLRCWSAYQDGTFCEIFHINHSGWASCDRCNDEIHYSCAISSDHYVRSALGGLICKACYEIADTAEKKWLPSRTAIINAVPPGTVDSVVSSSSPPQDTPDDSPVQSQATPQDNGASFSGPPGRRRSALVPDASGWVPLHPRYPLNARRSIPSNTESKVLILEKRLSAKSADPKVGSIIVSKAIAETYFCKLSPGSMATVSIMDEDGFDWDLILCLEPRGSRMMYILEGFGHFISTGQCKAGDKVTLHMIEGCKRFMIGFIDGSAKKSRREN